MTDRIEAGSENYALLHGSGLFGGGDPITLLTRRLHLAPWAATIAILLLLDLPILLSASASNSWLTTPNRIGLAEDYGWWVLQISSIPATVYYFLWLPSGISAVLEGLLRNNAIVIPNLEGSGPSRHVQFLQSFGAGYQHWSWALVSLIGAAIFTFGIAAPAQATFKTWQTANGFIFWATILFWLAIFFMGTLSLIRALLAIVWFNRLFREFEVNVKVLHPDGAGGLAPLGGFSVRVGYLIAVYGIAVVAAALSASYVSTGRFTGPMLTPSLTLLVILYLVLSPIIFFAPIGAARSSMRSAKNEALLRIALQFEIDNAELQRLISSRPARLEQALRKVQQLRSIHEMTSKFPVWPFNTQSLFRYFSAISSPFALGLLSLAIDLAIHR